MSGSSVEKYPQLLSLAVHELRTPASVVGGYLRMLQRDLDEPLSVRQRKMLDEAEKSCGRLVALIAEMSDIGKLDGGLIALARQPLDLFSVLREVAEHVHEARDRDVQFVLRGEDSALMIGDAARLRAAFDAVFRAILREKVGPVTVVAERRLASVDGRRSAVVVVADAACVQEAYERPRGVFNERRGGLGLALPLARRVFEGHGGRIWSPASNAPESPETSGGHDPLARASAIVALPLTE
jgi:signal transduction histidine kinase